MKITGLGRYVNPNGCISSVDNGSKSNHFVHPGILGNIPCGVINGSPGGQIGHRPIRIRRIVVTKNPTRATVTGISSGIRQIRDKAHPTISILADLKTTERTKASTDLHGLRRRHLVERSPTPPYDPGDDERSPAQEVVIGPTVVYDDWYDHLHSCGKPIPAIRFLVPTMWPKWVIVTSNQLGVLAQLWRTRDRRCPTYR